MNRRFFLKGALLVAAAPAIVRAESLMPVRAYTEGLFVPELLAYEAGEFDVIGAGTGFYVRVGKTVQVSFQTSKLCGTSVSEWDKSLPFIKIGNIEELPNLITYETIDLV